MKQAGSNDMDWETESPDEDPNNLFPQWEHLLTKSTRPLGAYSMVVEEGPQTDSDSPPMSFRLNTFRPRLAASIRVKWPDVKLEEISRAMLEDEPKPIESKRSSIALVGIIQKLQNANQSEVQRWCKIVGVLPLPVKKSVNGTGKEKEMFLSDTKTTVRLVNEGENRLSSGEIVSGVVCALKGHVRFHDFIVEDVMFPSRREPIWPTVTKLHNVEMVFISGLHIGKLAENFVYRNLLLEYLQGMIGNPAEQQHMVRRKSRAFILGNSFWKNPCKENFSLPSQVKTVKAVDEFLAQLSETMEVFILPGKTDPTISPSLPQTPLHFMMFPKSTLTKGFHRLPNPANIKVSISESITQSSTVKAGENLHMILCSGKNVSDALKTCNIKCPLKMSQKMLEWSHIHPTELENISLYNGKCKDVFCMPETLPHLYVVGNQDSFGVDNWKGVKIVSVPSFEKTHTIAFLTFDLEVIPINFNVFVNR